MRATLAAATALALAGPVQAAAPDTLSYQGVLQESGVAVSGSRNVEVAVCDAPSGGTCYGTGSQGVSVTNGIFQTTYTWPSAADPSGGPWHLEARVGGSPLSPREQLWAVPYALVASSGTDPTRVLKAGDSMTGTLSMGTNRITNVGEPAASSDAATKNYVDRWDRPCVNPNDPTDEMVAVGDFCVDKYEASAWSTPTGGTQYGGASDNYPCNDNGQDCAAGAANPIYARSVAGVTPSRFITWFQAAIACANAGKHLLANREWQSAARGTVDPGSTGTAPNCNILGGGPHATGAGTGCVSSWGAHDMIGNVWEWVADWVIAGQHYNGAPTSWTDGTQYTPWPAGYNSDGTWNVAGRSFDGSTWKSGLPGAVLRGGGWGNVADAGVFAFSANYGPSGSHGGVGFRCGRRR